MIFRWSFSQWENYQGCPRRWHYKSVMKLPTAPPGPAAARGLSMHDRVENYILGNIDKEMLLNGDPTKRFGPKKEASISEEYFHVIEEFKEHPNGDRYTEHRLGFDDEWYLSGTISKTTSCLMVLDAARCSDNVLRIGEWKSGSPKETHADQRKLYALGGLRKWIGVEVVEVTTYYLEGTAPPAKLSVKSSAEEKLKALWNGRVEQMQRDTICAPRPHDGCRWCDFAKAKGGPCAFGG